MLAPTLKVYIALFQISFLVNETMNVSVILFPKIMFPGETIAAPAAAAAAR